MTLHYSDLMHASLPPTSTAGPHRISVLMGFAPTGPSHHLGDRHYNDALLANQDGQIEHLGKPPLGGTGSITPKRRRLIKKTVGEL
ncbi:MAG: hypothetical protein CM1200mP26_26560 [Acidimicrobiales bacterium]|nr:MAG: hypothetical protein CM1200mP26_26560 [Acidimicrobiales bacterium]